MKEIKNKSIVKCPKCNSEATMSTIASTLIGLGIILLLAGGCLIWIPILGWICAPISIILGLVFIVVGLVYIPIGGATINCKSCNSKFKLTKAEYKMYKV